GVVFGELAQRLLGDDFVEEWLQASPVPLFENRVRRRLEPVLQSLLSPSRQLVELAPPAAGLRFPRQQTRLGQPLRLAVELRMRERPEIADRAADRSLELIVGRGAPEADQAQHKAGYGTQSHRRVILAGGYGPSLWGTMMRVTSGVPSDLSYQPADQTVPILDISLGDALRSAAAAWPRRAALVEGISSKRERR